MKHIEFGELLDKFEGRLPVRETREIDSHLAVCVDCQSESATLTDFFAYVARDETEQVPQAVTARILNIYQRRPLPVELLSEKPFGTGFLVFDDWAMALNERYSGLDSRQLLYRVGEYDIDLRIELSGDVCRLAGQVFPAITGAAVEISSSKLTSEVSINEFGEFLFEPVPQDDYDLLISYSSVKILLEKVPLQR